MGTFFEDGTNNCLYPTLRYTPAVHRHCKKPEQINLLLYMFVLCNNKNNPPPQTFIFSFLQSAEQVLRSQKMGTLISVSATEMAKHPYDTRPMCRTSMMRSNPISAYQLADQSSKSACICCMLSVCACVPLTSALFCNNSYHVFYYAIIVCRVLMVMCYPSGEALHSFPQIFVRSHEFAIMKPPICTCCSGINSRKLLNRLMLNKITVAWL